MEDHATVSSLPIEEIAEPLVLDTPVVDAPVLEAGAPQIEIVSPSGHRINITGAYDAEALCRLVRGLSS